MQGIRLFVAALAATLAGACASTQSSSGGSSAFLNYDDCFFARSMTDWRPLDNRNLVVFTGARRAYHVQLATPSMGLRFDDTIAFTDRDGRICPYGGDSIVINGLVPDRIPIASIRQLDEGQLEMLYRSYNIAGPEVIEAPGLAGEDE
jgi:hypothetical protein